MQFRSKLGDDTKDNLQPLVQASVYNVKTRSWIAPSEAVDYIEEGKERAEA
jgi:hypothetical protein